MDGTLVVAVLVALVVCACCGIEADSYRETKRALGQLATPPDRDAMGHLRSFADRLTGDRAEVGDVA